MPKSNKVRSIKQKAADKKKSDSYKRVKMMVNVGKTVAALSLLGGGILAGSEIKKLHDKYKKK